MNSFPIVYNYTKLTADRLPGRLGMDGMTRTVYNWAEQLSIHKDVGFFSAVPWEIVQPWMKEDPLFGWLAAVNRVGDTSISPSTLQEGFRSLMPPHGWSGVVHRLRRSLAYRWIARRQKLGSRTAMQSQKEGGVFYTPGTFLLSGPLPSGWVPVMNVYDVAPFIFKDTYTPKNRSDLAEAIRRFRDYGGHLTVNSEDVRHSVVCLFDFDPSRIHLVPLGASRQFNDEQGQVGARSDSPDAPKPYFLAINSGWQRRKNLRNTIAAFLEFRERTGSDWELWLTGGGSQHVAKEWGVSGAEAEHFPVRGWGYVDGAKLDELVRGASCGLYLSLYEGFGLPPLEFMNRSVPVICSNTGAVREVAGDSALAVDPLSITGISQAMALMATSPDLRQQFVQRGKSRAAEFTWEASSSRLMEVCREVNEQRRRERP
jgi:glycosyltransferase involved in cell wall biosynthesis